ncbi:BON domain-containing protein [bacterium]|nr:BON domain-containing protein [bacterium]
MLFLFCASCVSTGGAPETENAAAPPIVVRDARNPIPVSDEEIVRRMRDGFEQTRTVNPRLVAVAVHGGRVVVRGRVESIAERNLVLAVARTTPGVRGAVVDRLIVKPSPKPAWATGDPRALGDVVRDKQIEDAVKKRVARTGLVRLGDAEIVVHMGVVVLAAPVPNAASAAKLRNAVLYADGVRAYVDHTWVESAASDE